MKYFSEYKKIRIGFVNIQDSELKQKIDQLTKEVTSLRHENLKLENELYANELYHEKARKELQTAVQVKSKLQKTLQLSPDAFFYLNQNGEVKDSNEAGIRLMGFKAIQELRGVNLLEYIVGNSENNLQDLILQVSKSGESLQYENCYLKKNNILIPVIVTCNFDAVSQFVIAHIRDISLRKELEQTKLFLLKETSLRREISKVSSREELKQVLCSELMRQTDADEVWLIKKDADESERFYYGKMDEERDSFQLSVFNIEVDEISPLFTIPKQRKSRIYLQDKQQIYYLEIFKSPERILNQTILVVKLLSGHSYAFGLNYFKVHPGIFEDKVYLRSFSRLLNHAFDRMDTHEKLLENQAMLKALPEKLNDVIVVRTLEGEYIYVSPSVRKYGYEPEEILGKSAIDFAHPEDIHLSYKAIEEVLQEEGKSSIIKNIRIVLKDGSIANAELTLTNLLHQKGVGGIVINIRDITEQITFQNKLKESEEKYRVLFENAYDGIALLKDNKFVFYNEKFLHLFKTRVSEILGKPLNSLVSDYEANNKAAMKQVVAKLEHAQDKPVVCHLKLRRSDNSPFDAEVSFTRINLSDGVYVMMMVHDISEIQKAHKKIRENESRLRIIFESMHDGVYLCSKDFSIQYMNEAMRKQIGKINMQNRNCYKQIFDFEEPCKWCVADRLRLNENHIEEVYNPKTEKYYHASTSLIFIDGEEAILHISRDVTEIKHAEKLIRESEEKFRNIFNHSNDAIFITDLKGNYLEVNEKAASRAGYSKLEFLKMNFINLKVYSRANYAASYLEKVHTKGQATQEFIYKNQEGRLINTEVNSRLIEFQGEPAILHVSRDITKRKELERKVLETTIQTEENERSRFARDLHDGIGPYLSASKMMLKALAREDDPKERSVIIEKSITSIDEIIRNIKEISNNISPHVLQNFGLLAAINSFRKKLSTKELIIEVLSNLEDRRFDENLEISVFRIFIELINNTLKYEKASRIDLIIMQVEGELNIQFKHNGKGFNFSQVMKENRGSGLFNIMTRVKSLGGRYDFITGEDKGFHFISSFSLIQENDMLN